MIRKECLPLNVGQPVQITSQVIDNGTLTYMPVNIMPNIIKDDMVCGPLVMLLKELATKEKIMLRSLTPPESYEELALGLLSENIPDMLLMDLDSNNFITYQDKVKDLLNISHTITVDFMDYGTIACKKHLGTQQFTMFNFFDNLTWTLILASMLIISSLLTLPNCWNIRIRGLFNSLLANCWSISTLLISKTLPAQLDTTLLSKQIVISCWLALVLSFQTSFASFLLDNMIKPLPYILIDSWHDLYRRPEVTILVAESNAMVQFARHDPSPMAKSFDSRMEILVPETSTEFREKNFARLATGRYAYVTGYMILLKAMFMLANTSDLGIQDYQDQFHISSTGGGELPFFLGITSTFEPSLLKSFNDIILRIRESGLYSVWNNLVIQMVGNTHLLDKQRRELVWFEVISLNYYQPAQNLLIIGVILSIIVLLAEMYFYVFHSQLTWIQLLLRNNCVGKS